MKNWLVVMTEDNFVVSVKHGIIGFPRSMGTTAGKMKPGDQVVFYLSRKKVGQKGVSGALFQFAAAGKIKGSVFLSEDKIWNSVGNETYPVRCKVDITTGKRRVDIRPMIEALDFIKNKEHWGVSFFKSTRRIPSSDYKKISSALGI